MKRLPLLIVTAIVFLLVLGTGLGEAGPAASLLEGDPGESDAGPVEEQLKEPGNLEETLEMEPGGPGDPAKAPEPDPVSNGHNALRANMPAFTGYVDTVEVVKDAVPAPGCRAYEVTLSITGTPQPAPLDVILVLDRSGSMYETIPGSWPSRTPMYYLKKAAKDFAAKVLRANLANRVAVVWFHGPMAFNNYGYETDAELQQVFTSDLDQINVAIEAGEKGGGTNIQAGFCTANKHMENQGREGASRAIVLMTDGCANASVGHTTLEAHNYPTAHNVHTQAAYNEGRSCWNTKGGTSVFTIGLLNAVPATSTWVARDTLKSAQNKGFYEAASAENLTGIYNAIAVELDYSATCAVVADKIPTDKFEFVGITSYSQGSAPIYEQDTGTVTWDAGTIGTGAFLKIKIRALENYAGGAGIPTNDWATLTYTDLNGVHKTKDFPIPVVAVPGPLTVDAGQDRDLPLGGGTILGGDPVAKGGTAPYTYKWECDTDASWSSDDEKPVVAPTKDTEYTVTATDKQGCTRSASVKVTVLKGAITIAKVVESGSTTKKFPIYVEGKGHTWSMLLAHGQSATITGLATGEYTIREVVPMDYKAAISRPVITIGPGALTGEVTITNQRINDSWFRDDDERINTFKVMVSSGAVPWNCRGKHCSPAVSP